MHKCTAIARAEHAQVIGQRALCQRFKSGYFFAPHILDQLFFDQHVIADTLCGTIILRGIIGRIDKLKRHCARSVGLTRYVYATI